MYDSLEKKIVGTGYAGQNPVPTDSGLREQKPLWWIQAFDSAMMQALNLFKGNKALIAAIGVSRQQHGLAVLDKRKEVLCDSRLWNDTETSDDNEALVRNAGGISGRAGFSGE